MKSCEQTKGQSVFQHGESVRDHLFELIEIIKDGKYPSKYEWRLPEWIYEHKDLILSELMDRSTLNMYTLYHDAGKPYCKTIDDDGKVHFPDHAEVSYQVFKKIFPNVIDASELIRLDMHVHKLKFSDVTSFVSDHRKYAVTLLITALAEIHSNAEMFGGIESTSFKIKYKTINQRGKQILQIIKNEKDKS